MNVHPIIADTHHASSKGNRDDAPDKFHERKRFLIHKGRSADMILRSPSITGVTLCRGWSDDATKAFVSAIHKVGTFISLTDYYTILHNL